MSSCGNYGIFLPLTSQCEKRQILSHRNFLREINSFVKTVKTLLSRDFCKKCVRVNFMKTEKKSSNARILFRSSLFSLNTFQMRKVCTLPQWKFQDYSLVIFLQSYVNSTYLILNRVNVLQFLTIFTQRQNYITFLQKSQFRICVIFTKKLLNWQFRQKGNVLTEK